jgi:hypothetical protein
MNEGLGASRACSHRVARSINTISIRTRPHDAVTDCFYSIFINTQCLRPHECASSRDNLGIGAWGFRWNFPWLTAMMCLYPETAASSRNDAGPISHWRKSNYSCHSCCTRSHSAAKGESRYRHIVRPAPVISVHNWRWGFDTYPPRCASRKDTSRR